MPQYQMPRPMPPIAGAAAASTAFQPNPVSQPDQARYRGLHAQRFLVEASKRFDGPTTQDSYIFALGQPQSRRQIQIPRAKPPIDVAVVAVTPTDVFTLSQPDQARYAARQRNRFLVDAPRRIDDGAAVAVTQTDIFTVSQPDMARFVLAQASRYQMVAVPRPHEGAAAAVPQTYVFPLVQHYDARWYARRPIVGATERPHEGAAALIPQTYIFPLAQPELRGWLRFDANRVPSGPVPQLTGATSQATFIFPVSQPEMARFALAQVARRFGGTVAYPLDTFAPATFAERISIVGSYVMTINVVGDKT